jgi:hypothetical protein
MHLIKNFKSLFSYLFQIIILDAHFQVIIASYKHLLGASKILGKDADFHKVKFVFNTMK